MWYVSCAGFVNDLVKRFLVLRQELPVRSMSGLSIYSLGMRIGETYPKRWEVQLSHFLMLMEKKRTMKCWLGRSNALVEVVLGPESEVETASQL
jgi:hypothetical protein